MEKNNKGNVYAEWTGAYPNLCCGKWVLKVNDIDYSELLEGKGEMNTYGSYPTWYFDDDYCENWEYYEDGLKFPEWKLANSEWLEKITDNQELQEDIYEAIASVDWRHMMCGGCI